MMDPVSGIRWESTNPEKGNVELIGRFQVGGKAYKITFSGGLNDIESKMESIIKELGHDIIPLIGHEISLKNESGILINRIGENSGKTLDCFPLDSKEYQSALKLAHLASEQFILPKQIHNEKNFCYANSSLQVLFSSRFYFESVNSYRKDRERYQSLLHSNGKPNEKREAEFRLALIALDDALVSGKNIPKAREALFNVLIKQGELPANFNPLQQQDANVFINPILKLMGIEIQKASTGSSKRVNLQHFVDQNASNLSLSGKNLWITLDKPNTGEVPHRIKLAGKDYKLKGFQQHYKTAVGGHYEAYVNRGGKWYRCNDDKITLVPKEHVPKDSGYIFMYEEVSNS